MARVDCNTNCTKKHPFNGGSRNACKGKRGCACAVCGPLNSINAQLWHGCVDACNGAAPPKTTDEYLWEVGPDSLFNLYGILIGDITDTAQGQAEEIRNQRKDIVRNVEISFVGVLSLIFIAVFYFRIIKK